MSLDETLNKVLRIIKIHLTEFGYPPSVRELAAEMDVKSTSTIFYYLQKLEELGKIKRGSKKNRAIELVKNYGDNKNEDKLKNIPLIGDVAAGTPIFAYENYQEIYKLPESLFKGSDLFMLTVKGESMINAGIMDGDKIIVKKQNHADNRDIVVAMVNDEATVKRFFREDDQVRLQPENDTMQPMFFFDVTILGKVIGLLRNY